MPQYKKPMRTLTAQVTVAITVFVSDDAVDPETGERLEDDEAVSIAMESMFLNEELGLNPNNPDDLDTFGSISWNEPGILEIVVSRKS